MTWQELHFNFLCEILQASLCPVSTLLFLPVGIMYPPHEENKPQGISFFLVPDETSQLNLMGIPLSFLIC